MESVEHSFVTVIKQIMSEKGLTQLDIINRSGLKQATISHVLTQKRSSVHKHLPKICIGLEIKVSTFFERMADYERQKELSQGSSWIQEDSFVYKKRTIVLLLL